MAKQIAYQQCRFALWVSLDGKLATKNVRSIARKLTKNQLLQGIVGELRGSPWAEAEGYLRTAQGVSLGALGASQQFRGQLSESDSRPDLVILDDVEESMPYRTGSHKEYLKKLKDWFTSDFLNSLAAEYKVVYVGTVLGADSLLCNLL